MIVRNRSLEIENMSDMEYTWSGKIWHDVVIIAKEPIPKDFIQNEDKHIYISDDIGVSSINLGSVTIDDKRIVVKPKSCTYLTR